MMMAKAAAAALLVAVAAPASAQSLGDTQLAYSGGVVYDDDLVPGRGPDSPYLADEEDGTGGSAYGIRDSRTAAQASAERRRIDSRNLVGADGRAVRD